MRQAHTILSRRGLMQGAVAALAAVPFVACSRSEDVTKRIKIIAKAEVEGKPVEGSTVMEITWHPRGDGGMDAWVVGEAVVLELGGRGTVYVLPEVHTDDGSNSTGIWAYQVANAIGVFGAVQRKDLIAIQSLSGRFSFFPMQRGATLPVMVAFADETNPRSVYRVLPTDFHKFGNDVSFISIEFEPTNEPVTKVLAKRLPMLLEPIGKSPDHIRALSYAETPFEYKIGPISFFAPGKY